MSSAKPPFQDDGHNSLGIVKGVSKARVTKDGNPPRRRGPKPESQPALTRRQELNRQAQRTHRERKELYIKALEDEVLRLKEIYSNIAQDKERLADENRQLKRLISSNGMQCAGNSLPDDTDSIPSAGNPASAAESYSAAPSSHTSVATPLPIGIANGQHAPSFSNGAGQQHLHNLAAGHPSSNHKDFDGLDYEQAGIDFVLT
ncbi:hypothetical protein SEPCBS57363_005857 [Sporothrix epigloea]|uniref:BZIP domain-containing protein n=1 Tax=Sporothrix epigloea TaxID=1892477 RepID=A0ABP0E051_9PEZI